MAAPTGPFLFEAYLQQVKDAVPKAIWWSLIDANSIFTHLPMVTEGTLLKVGKRVIDNLPSVQYVSIGQEPTNEDWQPLVDFQEGVALTRKNFQLDRLFLTDKRYLGKPTELLVKAYMKALAFSTDNYFYNNNTVSGPIGDANGFVGIRYRLLDTSGPQGYSKWGCNPACIFPSTTNLSTAGLSGPGAIKLTGDWDKMIDHMDGGEGDGILCTMSAQALRQVDKIIKTAGTAGGFTITKDGFDRTIRKYRGMETQRCGYQAPLPGGLQIAPIISSSQDPYGYQSGDFQYAPNGNFYTSMFYMKRGEDYFTAWQAGDPWQIEERVPGTRQTYLLHDQSFGIFQQDTRALGVTFGVQCDGTTGD